MRLLSDAEETDMSVVTMQTHERTVAVARDRLSGKRDSVDRGDFRKSVRQYARLDPEINGLSLPP
jgi:hypothetical protein